MSQNREVAWVIFYEDPDHGHESFFGYGAEQAALRRFEQAQKSWNCTLFRQYAEMNKTTPIHAEAKGTLDAAAYFPPQHHHSTRFDWDFTTVSCRVCHGDVPVPEMPKDWDMRGHQPGCWIAPFLSRRESAESES